MTHQLGPLLTPDEVAARLGLHVKTVRRYIRDGQLASVRVGKRARVTQRALDEFAGVEAETSIGGANRLAADVSSIVMVEEIGRTVADRILNHLLTAAKGREPEDQQLRIEGIYDPDKRRLKVIVNGGLVSTMVILSLLSAVISETS